jgi:hypothetical protein
LPFLPDAGTTSFDVQYLFASAVVLVAAVRIAASGTIYIVTGRLEKRGAAQLITAKRPRFLKFNEYTTHF